MWLSSNKTRFYISLLIHINIWVFWGWCKDSNEKKVNKTSFWLIKNWLSSNQIFGATIIVTVGIFYLDCIANDTGQDIIQQGTSPLENLIAFIKKGKLKKNVWTSKNKKSFHCHLTRYNLRQKNKKRQTERKNGLTKSQSGQKDNL